MGIRLLRLSKTDRLPGGKWLSSKIATYWAKYLGRMASGPSRWFIGMLWGLVPCGLVYSVLPLAFLSGDVFTGAALMLAFGLGTLPNLLLISKFSAVLTQFGQYRWVRYLAASLLLIAGGFGLYRAWVLPEALLKTASVFLRLHLSCRSFNSRYQVRIERVWWQHRPEVTALGHLKGLMCQAANK